MSTDLTWNSEINQRVDDQLIINNSFPTFERYSHIHRGNCRYVWITSINSSLNAIKDICLRVTTINLVSANSSICLPKKNWDLDWNTCVFSMFEALNDQNIWIFHVSECHKRKTLIGFTVETTTHWMVSQLKQMRKKWKLNLLKQDKASHLEP